MNRELIEVGDLVEHRASKERAVVVEKKLLHDVYTGVLVLDTGLGKRFKKCREQSLRKIYDA